MTLAKQVFTPAPAPDQPPSWFTGTWPEYVCYREIQNQGYMEGEDFEMQSYQLGGRLHAGGLVIDFVFRRPPKLVIEVNGVYYHSSHEQQGRDKIKRVQMASLGYTLIFVTDEDLLRDPQHFVSEALNYRDHSGVG